MAPAFLLPGAAALCNPLPGVWVGFMNISHEVMLPGKGKRFYRRDEVSNQLSWN